MKKLILLIFFAISYLNLSAGTYSGGSGTLADPYKLSNLSDLKELCLNEDDWGSGIYFVQTANIDASETQYWDDSDDDSDGNKFNDPNDLTNTGTNDGFSTIGNNLKSFAGEYNGQNFTISNLFINRSSKNNLGFFGSIFNTTIKNISLVNVDIKGKDYIGGLCGTVGQSNLSNCNVSGNITTSSVNIGEYVGGLIAYVYSSSTIENCYTNCDILGSIYVGGLIGYCDDIDNISSCYSNSDVLGLNYVGGLVGYNWMTNIDLSYSRGTTTGTSYVGGLNGLNERSSITNSYSKSKVVGENEIGGFIGKNIFCNISYCFSTGEVSGNDKVGGFIGHNYDNAKISNCYSIGNVVRLYYESNSLGAFIGSNLIYGDVKNSFSSGSVTYNEGTSPTDKGFVGSSTLGTIYEDNFFDLTSSSQSTGIGASPKSSIEMRTEATFTNWDFSSPDVWDIESGDYYSYPYLHSIVYDQPEATPSVNPLPGLIKKTIAPTTQASTITFSDATDKSITINWVNGNGSKRAVFIKEETGTITLPASATSYTESDDWKNKGSQLGTSEYYCVYNGAGTSTSINNLNAGVEYHVYIFEYNGTVGFEEYNTSTATDNPNTFELIRYSGGSGKQSDPYVISTIADLILLSKTSDDWASGKYFIQDENISFDEDESLVDWDGDGTLENPGDDQFGFSPIGKLDITFKGNYDGQNHTISNLYINRINDNYNGLFGFTEGSQISNIGIINANFTTKNISGGLVGKNKNSNIVSCFSTGSISGGGSIGGLVGNNENSTISKCYSQVSVAGINAVGGFVGSNDGSGSTISKCFSTGNVSATLFLAGGFVGIVDNSSKINNCYSIGNVSRLSGGYEEFGGFGGYLQSGLINKCYSTGEVIYSGGTNPTNKGFLGVLYDINYASDNYFDTESSKQTSSQGATGKTTNQMKAKSTFQNWDFNTPDWKIATGQYKSYPYLNDIVYDEFEAVPSFNPVPSLEKNNINEMSISNLYDENTPGWGVTHFNNLSDALELLALPGTINISYYSHEGDLDFEDITIIIGDGNFEIDGKLNGGLIQFSGEGRLLIAGIPSEETISIPITDGTYNYTMTIYTDNASNPSISIKINNKNIDGIINSNFWDIIGPENLNATLTFRVDKAAIAPKTLNSNTQLRYFDGTKYTPVNGNNFSIEEFSDYYIITVTGVNEF